MKKLYPLFLFLTSISPLFAQCDGNRYRNIVFQDYVLTSDIVYGNNINLDNQSEDLLMDVYTPAGDNETNRPLVVLCHGGFFLGGDKAGADMLPLCQDLSRMGYVVASINYRMGVPLSPNLEGPYGQAVVRAVQDLKAAIRWFRKDVAENGNTYGIDPNHIYTGGASAGGFMALHHAYMDDNEIPVWLDMNGAGLSGGIEGNSGNAGYPSEVNAFFSVSGAIGNDTWIDESDTTPACLFHGDNDATVTIDSGVFVLFNIVDVTTIYGSNPIHARLETLGIENCYHITQGGGHVPYLGDAAVYDTTLSIISNFLSHYVCAIDLDCEYREVTTVVGVEESTVFSGLKIYPQPAEDILQVVLPSSELFNYEIFDMTGRRITGGNFRNQTTLNLEDCSAGVYLLRLQSGADEKTLLVILR